MYKLSAAVEVLIFEEQNLRFKVTNTVWCENMLNNRNQKLSVMVIIWVIWWHIDKAFRVDQTS